MRIDVDVGGITAAEPPVGAWDSALWDDSAARWSGVLPAWRPIGCRVRHIVCGGGRDGTLDIFGPSTATIEVANDDGFATWSPSAPAPVTEGSWLRVRCDDTPLFLGTVTRIEDDYVPFERPGAALVCVDMLGRLARVRLLARAPSWAGDTAAQRIGHLLDVIDWPAELRALDPGGPTLAATTAEGNVLDLCQRAAVTAGGALYADWEGRIVYRGGDWLRTDPRARITQAVVANDGRAGALCAVGMTANGPDQERVLNVATITGTDEATDPATAVTVVRSDDASQARYGAAEFPVSGLMTVDAGQLGVLGDRVIALRAQPHPRLDALELSPVADPPVAPATPPNLLTPDQATLEGSAAGWTTVHGTAARSTTRAREGVASLALTGGYAPPNTLPTSADASFDGGSVGSWTGVAGTLAATQTRADAGTWSGQLTAAAAGNPRIAPANSIPSWARVNGVAATLIASVWTSTARTVNLAFQLYDTAGAPVGSFNFGPVISSPGGGWARLSRYTTLPANAAYLSFQPQIVGVAAGEVTWFDRLGVFAGNIGPEWWTVPGAAEAPVVRTPPNLVDAATASVEAGTVAGYFTTGTVPANVEFVADTARGAHGRTSLRWDHKAGLAPALYVPDGSLGRTTVPAGPGQTFTFMVDAYTAAAGRSITVGYRPATVAGVPGSATQIGAARPLTAGAWTRIRGVATLPAGDIGYVQMYVQSNSTAPATTWLDRFGIFAGDVADWATSSPGGHVQTTAPVPAIPGVTHTFMGSLWADYPCRATARLQWLDRAGATLGTDDVDVDSTPGGWRDWTVQRSAPVGTTQVRAAVVTDLPPGLGVALDRLGVYAGPVTVWAPPGADPGRPGSGDYVKRAAFGDRVDTVYRDPNGWGWEFSSHVQAVDHDITPAGADHLPAAWTCTLTLDDATYWQSAEPWDTGRWDAARWAGGPQRTELAWA